VLIWSAERRVISVVIECGKQRSLFHLGSAKMPTILAFTSPQVQRLTGLSARRLTYWEDTGVFRASYVDERPRRAYRRIFSFTDVVSLRTLALLCREVSLDELRRTGQYLARHSDAPWTRKFWIQDKRVFFHDPEDPSTFRDLRGQTSFVDVADVWAAIESETATWKERPSSDIGRVSRHRHVQRNQWVIKGTRIPTAAIWSFHEAGYDNSEIIRQYPTLTPEDVKSALDHERQQRTKAA
jgi:uncharacterized protein (DUF433 family)/DNA-binding transcriptional MerR regulator